MTYSEKLKDPRWQQKRLRVFERDNFTCRSCSDKETELQVHHLEYKGDPWQAEDDKLITLCKHCHSSIEIFKNKYDLNGYSFKVMRKNIVFLAIPEGDIIHLFKIHFGNTEYIISLANNILKDFIHHVINWWLETDKEENLNLYKSSINGKRSGIPVLPE